MSRLYADIHRKIEDFELDVLIASDAKRIGILGASGSGKSMTLRSIAGIEDVDSGRIEAAGRVLRETAFGHSCPSRRSIETIEGTGGADDGTACKGDGC